MTHRDDQRREPGEGARPAGDHPTGYPARDDEPPRRLPHAARHRQPPYRWECPCQTPPVLLATWTPNGRINIKVRDRYWHLYGFGQIHAVCPRCGGEHILDLHGVSIDAGAGHRAG